MAQKRKAQQAFGKPQGQLSAFAAARLAKQSKQDVADEQDTIFGEEQPLDATSLAGVPYDGHHDDVSSSDAESQQPDIVVAATPRTTSHVSLSDVGSPHSISEDEDGSLTIILNDGESIVCVGEYDLRVEQGIVTVFGAVLHPKSGVQRAYASSTHALPRINARTDGTIIRITHAKFTIRKLEKLSPLFRNLWVKDGRHNRTFALLHTAADDELQRSLTPLDIDRTTETVLTRLAAEAESTAHTNCMMAIGAKSSGKSTLNRFLCNTLLSRPSVKKVMYLDLDPGQPEFGPPGQLSLVEVSAPMVGPPLTHPASARSGQHRSIRSHTIAATSFKDDPDHYLACAKELIQHANIEHPLIINSCGWVTGLGAKMLLDLVATLEVTDAVLLEPLDTALSDMLRAQSPDTAFHRVARQPPRPTARTPAESRNMQTMAYFHARSTTETKWSAKPLSASRPWVVKYDGPGAGIQAVLSYDQGPSPEFLGEVLDGTVVALVVLEDAYFDRLSPHTASIDAPGLAFTSRTIGGLPYPRATPGQFLPLDPKFSECVGVALVRAIDTERKELHLVTPLSEGQIASLMDRKIVLVRGGFDAPEWAYLEGLHSGEAADDSATERPWVTKKEAVGIEGAVWRLRHPPMAADVR